MRSGARSARGNRPSEEWTFVASVSDETGKWSLHSKPQKDPAWVYVKVWGHGWRKGKANYWLSWSGSRFAAVGDFVRLIEERPELLDLVRDAMVEHEAHALF